MSELTATNCGCGCENSCGNSGSSCWWIIILVLLFCCCGDGFSGFGGGCGNNSCGCGFGGDSCWWIIIILFFCCGGCGSC